jgi:hypothetical protein
VEKQEEYQKEIDLEKLMEIEVDHILIKLQVYHFPPKNMQVLCLSTIYIINKVKKRY